MELSMLEEQLLDEYFRGERHIKTNQDILNSCPKGYLVYKKIKGRKYCYRQWRDGKKICSEYVRHKDIDGLERRINIRKKAEHSIKMIRRDMKNIERLLGRNTINGYRNKI